MKLVRITNSIGLIFYKFEDKQVLYIKTTVSKLLLSFATFEGGFINV